MKMTFAALIAASAMILSAAAADVTAKLSDVHICCGSCVKVANKIIATVPGVKGDVSQDDDTITLTAADKATVQKVVDALVEGGFFGTSSNPDIKLNKETGAKGVKVTTLEVSNVHLCCGSCVTAVNKTLKAVPGVTGTTAARNAKTFEVTGDFTDTDIFAALQKAGLTGKVATKN